MKSLFFKDFISQLNHEIKFKMFIIGLDAVWETHFLIKWYLPSYKPSRYKSVALRLCTQRCNTAQATQRYIAEFSVFWPLKYMHLETRRESLTRYLLEGKGMEGEKFNYLLVRPSFIRWSACWALPPRKAAKTG
jgi:hypothetical protein